MNLITPLASGIRGAENGSVAIYQRGTSQFVTYYQNFDASGAVTPTAPVALDAFGGGTFYVNQLVTCVARDSNGNVVRTFDAGTEAPSVEVISQSFTGTDYTTGTRAASEPTTLQAVLDAWRTSAGTTDFNVSISSVSMGLAAAFANTAVAMFINVKSTLYGAVGDGVTDDTAAIQSAINVVNAAPGGIVYFPKGNYRITSALSITSTPGIMLLGGGERVSNIALDHATANGLSFTSGASTIAYLSIFAFQNNSGSIISVSSSATIRVIGSQIGDTGPVGTTGRLINMPAGGTLTLLSSKLAITGSTASFLNMVGGTLHASACEFVFPSLNYTGTAIVGTGSCGLLVNSCLFSTNSITGGTSTIFNVATTTRGWSVTGCGFASTLGGTVIWAVNPTGSVGMVEAGNTFGSGYTFSNALSPIVFTPSAASHEGAVLASRQFRRYYQAVDTTPVNLPTSLYGYCEVARSNNANQTITFDDPPGPGHHLTLALNNNQGAVSGTITMGGTNIKGVAPFTVNANKVSYYHFRSVEVGVPAAHLYWSFVSVDPNESP